MAAFLNKDIDSPSEHFVFDISVIVQYINLIYRSVFVMAYIHWFSTCNLNSYLAISLDNR